MYDIFEIENENTVKYFFVIHLERWNSTNEIIIFYSWELILINFF